MHSASCPRTRSERPRLRVDVATTATQIAQAQRLRFQVFTEEFGARLDSPVPGLDLDTFDPHCDHLVVTDVHSGSVVATTRLLSDAGARAVGRFYSETEFDLSGFKAHAGRVLEIGRTCVHPAFRSGATLSLLWSGIAAYVLEHDYDQLIGCGSIPVNDGGATAWAITERLLASHRVEDALTVSPRRPLPRPARIPAHAGLPPLIKAYMRLGARIGGEPCHDPDFGCADLFIILRIEALAARYSRHFLKREHAE
ncbi:MAG: GNAT family N-acetyltransferase [Gammaproteobacteria bacterium]|nr:MAG: GNAT family N-acetyltransferase [Gammaproteobacteria bacterium]